MQCRTSEATRSLSMPRINAVNQTPGWSAVVETDAAQLSTSLGHHELQRVLGWSRSAAAAGFRYHWLGGIRRLPVNTGVTSKLCRDLRTYFYASATPNSDRPWRRCPSVRPFVCLLQNLRKQYYFEHTQLYSPRKGRYKI